MKALSILTLGLIALVCTSAPVSAQEGEGEGEGEEQAPQLTPPELVEFVEADYPPEAEAEGLEATVELEVTIDAEGTVTECRVVTPRGHGFDEAAVAAVERFRFEPARRDGEAVPSRIRYRYVFELREVEPPPDETPPDETPPDETDQTPGRLSGEILTAGDDLPVPSAEVTITSADGETTRSMSVSPDGTFRFDDLAPGTYVIHIVADEFGEETDRQRVGPGEATELVYRLVGLGGGYEFSATARIEAPPREVVRRTITREELTRIPGTRGDALRTVELLPGVGRPPFATGQLIVRGASPQDSQVFLDNAPVPLLYHFGGLTSFYNSRLLDQIDFYPGNFSARYGRKIGGILDVTTRDPAIDRFHAVADVNLIDASLLVEAPLGDHVSVSLAARRSYIDFFFQNVIPDDAFDVITAPVYYDYQATLVWRPTNIDKVRFNVYGSSDNLALIFSQPQGDPNIRGNFDLTTQFHRGFIGWTRKLSPDVDQNVQFAIGPTLLDFGLGDTLGFNADFLQMNGRAEWIGRLNDRVRVIGGLDIDIAPFGISYLGPPIQQAEGTNPGNSGSLGDQDRLRIDADGVAYRPAMYAEADLRPWDFLQVVMGLRLDWFDEIRQWAFDPRLVTVVTVAEGHRVKAGVGSFSQPPEFQESSPELGNPDLLPLRALHTDVGWEWDLTEGVKVGLEAFYKYIWDRPVSTFGGTGSRFVSQGQGRIYGLEVSGRVQPIGRNWFGFLSYTLMRSERLDNPANPEDQWRLFDFDQTHILSVAGVYRFPKGWEAGATFRLISGNPYTPVTDGTFNANTLNYEPITGPINSERAGFFHRLDLRVEKKWTFSEWFALAFYIDIQNVYNATNSEGVLYDYRYRTSVNLPSLPIIPSLGVRGEI